MDAISGMQIHLTASDADQMEKDVTAQGEIDGLIPHFWREEEKPPGAEPMFTLAWILLPPGEEPPRMPGKVLEAGPKAALGALASAADRVGVPRRMMVAFALAESGLDAAAQADGSTAFGLLQITNPTWIGAVSRYGATYSVTEGDRRDPVAQALMGAALVAENVALLSRRLGRAASETEVYLGQLLGGPAAATVLLAPSAPVMATLETFYAGTKLGSGFASKVAAANPALLGQQGLQGDGLLAILQSRIGPRLTKADELLGEVGPRTLAMPAPPTEPAWFRIARSEEAASVAEVPGKGNNPRIMEYFSWTTLGEQPDEVPWCGAFVSFCFGKAGEIAFGKGSARAADWKNFGTPLATPRSGCLVVLKPQAEGASGHVAFLVSATAAQVRLLGGNQDNRVAERNFGRDQVVPNGFRWPA